jgi:hypothetical protein
LVKSTLAILKDHVISFRMTSRTIETAKYAGEPVFVNKDGTLTPYIPHDIVGHREMYGASLHLVLKHTADFHMTMLEILADKYGLPVDEMYEKISGDPRFVNMVVNPTIHAMGYFEKEDLEKKVPPPAPTPEPVIKKIIKPKKPTAIPSAPEQPAEANPAVEVKPATVKKIKKPQVMKSE